MIDRSNTEVEKHLERHLTNRAKRTGVLWQVEERYSRAPKRPQDTQWLRALIVSAKGERVRLYYRYWTQCWVVA